MKAFAEIIKAVDLGQCERAPAEAALVISSYLDSSYPFTDPAEPADLHQGRLRQAYVSARLPDLPLALTRESAGIGQGRQAYLVPSVKQLLAPTSAQLRAASRRRRDRLRLLLRGHHRPPSGPVLGRLNSMFGVEHQLRPACPTRFVRYGDGPFSAILVRSARRERPLTFAVAGTEYGARPTCRTPSLRRGARDRPTTMAARPCCSANRRRLADPRHLPISTWSRDPGRNNRPAPSTTLATTPACAGRAHRRSPGRRRRTAPRGRRSLRLVRRPGRRAGSRSHPRRHRRHAASRARRHRTRPSPYRSPLGVAVRGSSGTQGRPASPPPHPARSSPRCFISLEFKDSLEEESFARGSRPFGPGGWSRPS